MARVCLATGIQPSEYWELDLLDLDAFAEALKERNT